MNESSEFRFGIEAFKAGNKTKAREHFLKATRLEPNNEHAWGWLSNTSTDDAERLYCLRQVVSINPQNESAKKLLAQLESAKRQPVAPSIAQTNPPIITTSTSTQQLPVQSVQEPWYRSGFVYILTFLFLTPIWCILIVTDKRQPNLLRVVAAGIGVVLFMVICSSIWGVSGAFGGAASCVDIVSVNCSRPGYYTGAEIQGTIRNSCSQTISGVFLRGTFYDALNNVVGTNLGMASSDVLYPDATSQYWMLVDAPVGLAESCKVHVEQASYGN